MTVTVLVKAASSALTTKEHARGDLGAMASGVSDAQLDRWIAQASATAASFCRRTFGRETLRERFDVRWGAGAGEHDGLLLDGSPVASITSVTVDGLLLAPITYEADERFLYALQDGERRCWTGRSIVVEYVAGWWLPSDTGDKPADAIDLPADIERAVIQLVGVAVSASGRDPTVKSDSVDGVGSQSFYVQGASAALPQPGAEAALQQYRRMFCG